GTRATGWGGCWTAGAAKRPSPSSSDRYFRPAAVVAIERRADGVKINLAPATRERRAVVDARVVRVREKIGRGERGDTDRRRDVSGLVTVRDSDECREERRRVIRVFQQLELVQIHARRQRRELDPHRCVWIRARQGRELVEGDLRMDRPGSRQ